MDSEAVRHDPYAALRLRSYRLFAASSFLAGIGGQMQSVAALYEVYMKTGSSLSLGAVGAVLAVPMLFLALPAGHFADNHSRRRTVICTTLISMVCTLGLAYLSFFHSTERFSITGMYVLLGIGASATTFGRPSRTAMFPQLVPAPIFTNAVTWNTTLMETAAMGGPALGGLICSYSVGLTYVISAICALAATLFVYLLHEPPRQPSGGSGARNLLAGLRFVFSTRLMLSAMTLDMFAVLLGGAVYLLPAIAAELLHVGAVGFGWLRAAPAIGAFSMALIQAHHPPHERAGRMLLLTVAGFGLVTIIFGFSRNFALSFVMLILLGMFDNISVVIRHTLVQMLTPDAMRGRVSSVNQIFIGSSNEIGGLRAGVMAAYMGLTGAVVFGGMGTLLVVGVIAACFPELRRLGSLRDIRPLEAPTDPAEPDPAPVPK